MSRPRRGNYFIFTNFRSGIPGRGQETFENCVTLTSISLIVQLSSKAYYKRPSGAECGKSHVGVSFLSKPVCAEVNGFREERLGYMGALGNRDCGLASRSVLKDFTDDVLTIPAGNLFQNGIAPMLKAWWRRRVKHLSWWTLKAWLRGPLQVGWAPSRIQEDHG